MDGEVRREGVCDGAFAAGRCRAWSNVHGMRHRVVSRDPQAKGFVVLARRWVVERSFGWLSHWDGLAKDRGGRLDVSAARLALVGILSGFEALLNPMPVRAAAQITSVAARICTSASTSGIAGFPISPESTDTRGC